MSEINNSLQSNRKKRKLQHDFNNQPMFIFQENHQRKFMKNQNCIENKINNIVSKFNKEITKLNDKISDLKQENNDLHKENKHLIDKLSTNQLSIYELRKEMTQLYLSMNDIEVDNEVPYIN